MAKVYVITSGKGGVGKTTSAINLGAALNLFGTEVIVVDANLTTPNIGLHLGAPVVPINLNHVINNKSKIEDAIYEHESGTKIIPASLSLDDLKKTNHHKLSEITKKLRRLSDHIILDCAAGLGEEAISAIKASDELIVIANPEISSVTDALKTIKLAERLNKTIKGFIITRYQGARTEMSIPNIQDMLEVPLLGIIPEDRAIKESQVIKNAVVHTHPRSKSARSYKEIAKKILGPQYMKTRIESRESLFSKFLRKIGL